MNSYSVLKLFTLVFLLYCNHALCSEGKSFIHKNDSATIIVKNSSIYVIEKNNTEQSKLYVKSDSYISNTASINSSEIIYLKPKPEKRVFLLKKEKPRTKSNSKIKKKQLLFKQGVSSGAFVLLKLYQKTAINLTQLDLYSVNRSIYIFSHKLFYNQRDTILYKNIVYHSILYNTLSIRPPPYSV